MKNTVNMDALKACAVLSGFNWYKVNVNRDGNESEFYATELEVTHEGATIKIHRQFATPEYMGGFTKITAAAENCIVFEAESMDYSSGNGRRIAIKYTVEGLCKDFADLDNYGVEFDNMGKLLCDHDTLESLTDYNRSHKDENGNLLVVLDLRKLGRLTGIQCLKIRQFMNVYCGGNGTDNQTPRTVYFKFAENSIIAGVWDYATEQPMSEKMFYESWLTIMDGAEEENKQAEALRKLAQTAAAAM